MNFGMFPNFNMFNMQNNQMNNMQNMNLMNNFGNNMFMGNVSNNMGMMGNNMGGMNQMFNPMNNMNNFMSPIKGIKNFTNNIEASFINSVLQALCCLNCIKNWYMKLNNVMNNLQPCLTKSFLQLIYCLYSGNQPDSSNIIFQYNLETNKLLNKNPKTDPFHFLFYFLDLLHYENNYIIDKNFNAQLLHNPGLENMKNDTYMSNIFQNYFKSTQNSFVAHNFFNILKIQISCPNFNLNCYPLFSYEYRKIFDFHIDKYRNFRDEAYPNKMGMNLTLEDCFKCYTGGMKIQCHNCGSFNANSNTLILFSTKVLILAFKRNNHNFKCDIDFDTKINFSMFCKDNIYGTKNVIYNLTACISLCGMPKYFSDICINGKWFRFMDDQIKVLNNFYNDIHTYEPQILIYELEENQNFANNMMNNGFNNGLIMSLNQMQYNQMLMQIGNLNNMMINYKMIKGFN